MGQHIFFTIFREITVFLLTADHFCQLLFVYDYYNNLKDCILEMCSATQKYTGCSLNIVLFRNFLNMSQALASFGFPSVYTVCVHNGKAL